MADFKYEDDFCYGYDIAEAKRVRANALAAARENAEMGESTLENAERAIALRAFRSIKALRAERRAFRAHRGTSR